MKPPQSPRLFLKLLLLTSIFTGMQCGQKDEPASSQGTAPSPAAVKAPSLVDQAAKLGFAGKLPQETELYLGSVNLKTHITALKNSAWWKDVNALMQDKTPAPTAGDKSMATLEKLWGDDVFLVGGQGFAASAAQLRAINRVYNEVYFKMLMTGGAAGAFGNAEEGAQPNPMMYLQLFLQDPATLEKVAGVISSLELPPLLIGFKTEKPEEVLTALNDTKQAEEKKIFVMSDHSTAEGHKFRVATIDMSNILVEADQEKALALLPMDTPDASRKVIEKAYDDLQSKKFKLAWGAVDGHVIFACGQNLDHLKFAASPAQSVLAKPELAWLLPHAGKNLTGLTYASAASLSALNDDQPFVPMLRGAAGAMKENPMFKALGDTLEKQIAELSPIEAKVYATEATNLVGVAWWDRGLHTEFIGGLKPKFLLPENNLKYAGFVNQPGVVFGLAYHRNKQHEQDVRAWMEKVISIAYSAAQELIKAGIAGPQGGQSFAMFELMLLPTIKGIYQADKDIDEKGLGSEIAYILDVNGKMPELPGVPPTAKDVPLPRITAVSDVANRGEIAKGWKTINETITGVASIIAGFTQPAIADPSAPAKPPFVVPQPQSTKSGDFTTWSYSGEWLKGDLSPSSTISDKYLVLSTSKNASETYAAELTKPVDKQVTGAVWKLDLSAAADWMARAATMSPTTTPESTKQMQEGLKWIRPFREMEGRIYQEKGQWKLSMDWEIADVVKFD